MGEDGRAINREVLEYVAEPLEVTGALERAGDLWVLRTGPSAFRRLS